MRYLLLVLFIATGFRAVAKGSGPIPADALMQHYIPLLLHKQVALVANQTSRVCDSLLPDMLLARGVAVKRILVPEHGFRGREDAGANVENSIDSATGLPVVSLYGKHKKPLPEDLADVDIVVYDLQDVGVRFYTYISTLEYVMEACADNHKALMILDRPNPNGFCVDGPVLEPEQRSFVGMQPIPVLYGMTAGEYAKMLKGEGWVAGAADLDLQVIPCELYSHHTLYTLPVAPSPNLRNMTAVYLYASLCLFEGTPVSVGRGTDRPFQQYGCPEFAGKFSYSFTPRSTEGAKHPPHENKICYGEEVATNETAALALTRDRLQLKWLIKAYYAYPDKEKFFTPFFTKLCGTTKLQEQVKSGMTGEQIRATWQRDLDAFRKIRDKYLIYDQ